MYIYRYSAEYVYIYIYLVYIYVHACVCDVLDCVNKSNSKLTYHFQHTNNTLLAVQQPPRFWSSNAALHLGACVSVQCLLAQHHVQGIALPICRHRKTALGVEPLHKEVETWQTTPTTMVVRSNKALNTTKPWLVQASRRDVRCL